MKKKGWKKQNVVRICGVCEECNKEDESVTLWVSADKNKIPVKIKADLRVGSINADLEAFKGLKYPFKIQL